MAIIVAVLVVAGAGIYIYKTPYIVPAKQIRGFLKQ